MNTDYPCIDGDVLDGNSQLHFIPREVIEQLITIYKQHQDELNYMYLGTEEGVLYNIPAVFNNQSYDCRFRLENLFYVLKSLLLNKPLFCEQTVVRGYDHDSP